MALTALVPALLLAPTIARAQSIEDFEAARAAYEARDFARAVQYFEELVGTDPPRLSSPALVVEARKYFGAAYLFLGRRDAAIHQFELLLRAEPDYRLDPLLFPAAVQELFDNVRERLALEAREAEARRGLEAELARERERSAALLEIASDPVFVEVESSRWAAMVPWGTGQFLNGDDGLGWFFFLGETALLGAAFGSLAWRESLLSQVAVAAAGRVLSPDLVNQANPLLTAAAVTNWVSLGSLAVLVVAGILQAQIGFVPSRSIRHDRTVPDELREGLDGDGSEDPSETIPAPPPSGVRLEPGALGIPLSFRF